MNNITTEQAAQLIRASGGRIFTVQFTKRSTGELRLLNGRLGVHSHLKGGRLAFDPAEKNLIICFDLEKMQYRSIAVEGLRSLTLEGNQYHVRQSGEAT